LEIASGELVGCDAADGGCCRFVCGFEQLVEVDACAESDGGHELFAEETVWVGGFEVDGAGVAVVALVEVVVESGLVFPAPAAALGVEEVAAGAGPGGEPGRLIPVGEVVGALVSGRGEVGDFVTVEPCVGAAFDGVFVHVGFEVVVGGGEVAAFEAGGHRSVGLVGEGVAGEVGGAEGQGGGEVGVPLGEGLAGDCEDEVDACAFDAGGLGEGDSAGDACGVVPAFEGLEVAWVEGLSAHAESVDAAGAEDVEELGRGGFGVALDAELGAVGVDF